MSDRWSEVVHDCWSEKAVEPLSCRGAFSSCVDGEQYLITLLILCMTMSNILKEWYELCVPRHAPHPAELAMVNPQPWICVKNTG